MKLKVRVNRAKPESMTKQITGQLTSLIETGALAAGELLPSERTLADTLGVARNVVRRSYDYLTTGGHVESEGRKGKRVRSQSAKGRSGTTANASSKASKKSKSGGKSSGKSGTKGTKARSASVAVRVGTKKRK
jgi:DNA-binding FadR family transcriptional regulator